MATDDAKTRISGEVNLTNPPNAIVHVTGWQPPEDVRRLEVTSLDVIEIAGLPRSVAEWLRYAFERGEVKSVWIQALPAESRLHLVLDELPDGQFTQTRRLITKLCELADYWDSDEYVAKFAEQRGGYAHLTQLDRVAIALGANLGTAMRRLWTR